MKFDLFQKHVGEARSKMKANEFCDVTLVSNDNCRFEAHKVILSSSSEVFKNLLVNERHTHPLIFMSGTKGAVLQAVLDFIYSGEAQVEEEDVKSFIKLSNQVEVFGLTMEVLDKGMHVQKYACKHWNRGFCKRKENCQYEHLQEDCETHRRCETCQDKECNKRHRKLAETGWEKVVGENKTVHICTRIQKRQKEKHFRKVAAITSITEAPEAKAEVNIIQLINTNVVGTEALEAEALEI